MTAAKDDENENEQQQQQQKAHLWFLLRGPCLIALAVLSVLISVAQSLSLLALLQLSLLGLGLCVLGHDATIVGQDELRKFLRQQIESVVWDDVMYRFWHPQYEWWAVFVETILGQASWMYILPSTSTQRVQLVQASLQVSEEVAKRILFAPGGYKHLLLPKSFVQWLDGGGDADSAEENNADATGNDEAASNSSSTESTIPITETEDCLLDPSEPTVLVEHADALLSSEDVETENKNLPSISSTMQSVIVSALSDQLRQTLPYVPESRQLAGVSVAAAAALALQLRCSPRARKIALAVLETSSMAGLATITTGAASLLLAKTFGPGGAYPINESTMLPYISKVLQLRKMMVQVMKRSSARTEDSENKEKSTEGDDDNNRNRVVYQSGAVACATTLALLAIGLKRRSSVRYQRRQTER